MQIGSAAAKPSLSRLQESVTADTKVPAGAKYMYTAHGLARFPSGDEVDGL